MPGVRRIDIYDYYSQLGIQDPRKEPKFKTWNLNMSNNYTEFAEVLVGSGGVFWKDAEQSAIGFRKIGTIPITYYNGTENLEKHMTVFETYYFMD